MSHADRRAAFAALHVPGDPVVIYNVWDAGSAVAVARAGARAIATGSWGVAGAHGLSDGEGLPLDLVLANTARIVAVAGDLPVSIDLETGYGDVAASARAVVAAGAVGINLEDRVIGEAGLVAVDEQCRRIAAAVDAGLFVNARCDLFIKAPRESHDGVLVDEALARARAYADAGAGSFFAPFLHDGGLIGELCAASPLPVNILVGGDCPSHAELARLGVARISHGQGPWAAVMGWLEAQARAAIGSVRSV